jgi:hypothetical protein
VFITCSSIHNNISSSFAEIWYCGGQIFWGKILEVSDFPVQFSQNLLFYKTFVVTFSTSQN